MGKRPEFSQDFLKTLFLYDEATGLFTRLRRRGPGGKDNGRWLDKPVGGLTKGYVTINIDGIKYYAHRLAWLYVTGEWPDEVDHINLDKTDNRFENLRECTRTQNCFNRAARSTNTSGQPGVTRTKGKRRWRVRIQANGIRHFIGDFIDFDEARNAYLTAQKSFHGEFGRS